MSHLDRLFYWHGISDSFYNYKGQYTPVPLENRTKLLNAMGVDTSSAEVVENEVFRLDIEPWLRWVPPLLVSPCEAAYIDISCAPEDIDSNLAWRLCFDGTEINRGDFYPQDLEEVGDYFHEQKRYSRRRLPLGGLDPNYYHVSVVRGEREESCELVAAPKTAYLPEWSLNEEKLWGFVVQLYTFRSENNWGIGDFSDLFNLVEQSAKIGADIIGLNPFHTLQQDLKYNCSPYSPSDRRFLNPLYIDVPTAPGYQSQFFPTDEIQVLRDLSHVDYEKVKALKYSRLSKCFRVFLSTDIQDFISFVEQGDSKLIAFVAFEAQSSFDDATHAQLLAALKKAPQQLSNAMHELAFHCYLQWAASVQLERCQRRATELGMKVGLLRDLAVGASGAGSEVKTMPRLFCDASSIGAPPDPLALTGQNWGVPPMDPAEMRHSGFAHIRDLIRSNMRSSGALRIDHAMSLYRLWWCPPGDSPEKGAYVYYPLEELMGILCLESHLNKCSVVAEDLGIVPDEFRHAMVERGLYGNKVFYFEKTSNTVFRPPCEYEPHALAMVNNHDVPTMTSWWNDTDIMLREELSMMEEGSSLEDVLAHRLREKINVLSQINKAGLLPQSWKDKDARDSIDGDLMHAILKYTAHCASQFFVIQLEDLLLMNDPVNVPGTFLEHKNWTRKLTKSLNDIFSDSQISKALSEIDKIRKN